VAIKWYYPKSRQEGEVGFIHQERYWEVAPTVSVAGKGASGLKIGGSTKQSVSQFDVLEAWRDELDKQDEVTWSAFVYF